MLILCVLFESYLVLTDNDFITNDLLTLPTPALEILLFY